MSLLKSFTWLQKIHLCFSFKFKRSKPFCETTEFKKPLLHQYNMYYIIYTCIIYLYKTRRGRPRLTVWIPRAKRVCICEYAPSLQLIESRIVAPEKGCRLTASRLRSISPCATCDDRSRLSHARSRKHRRLRRKSVQLIRINRDFEVFLDVQ